MCLELRHRAFIVITSTIIINMIRCYIRTKHIIPSWSLDAMICLATKTGHVRITNQCSLYICIEKRYVYIYIIYIYKYHKYIYTHIMHKNVYLHTPKTWTFQFHRSHTRFASRELWRLQWWSTPVWTRYKVGPYHYKAHVAIHCMALMLSLFCHVFCHLHVCLVTWGCHFFGGWGYNPQLPIL